MAKRNLKRLVIAMALTASLSISCNMGMDASTPQRPPEPPRNLRVSIYEDGVQLTWEPVPKAIKYTVFWGSAEGEYRDLADTNHHFMELPGLKRGEKYSFAVSAWNEKGESDYSNEVVILNDFDSSHASHYLGKGNELLERGYYLDADLYFATAIRLDPKNPDAYNSRARLHEKLSRYGLAEQDYETARLLSAENGTLKHSAGSKTNSSKGK